MPASRTRIERARANISPEGTARSGDKGRAGQPVRQARGVSETWRTDETQAAIAPDDAARTLRDGLGGRPGCAWLHSSSGRSVALVSNGERAMVMLLEYTGDPGFHAVDPRATDEQQGDYLLDNGQVDTYANRHTVPLAEGIEAVAYLVQRGELDPRLSWQSDR